MTAALLLLALAADGPVDVVEHLGERIADARFRDAQQELVTVRELSSRGKPVLVTLVYFDCPMLCSLVQQGLIKALKRFELITPDFMIM